MSVCLSVCQVWGETWFSRPLYKIELSFFCAHSSYMSIYYTNTLSVGLSKGKRSSLLMDVVILVYIIDCYLMRGKNGKVKEDLFWKRWKILALVRKVCVFISKVTSSVCLFPLSLSYYLRISSLTYFYAYLTLQVSFS